jgi:TonB-dependent receptor
MGLSGLALGSMAFSGQLYAADTTATTASDSALEEITVTGIRASLQQSLDIKRDSFGIVDAISAEDIGKFPDSNLAAAMERVPGVTVTRAAATLTGTGGTSTTGEPTQITVRGFGPQFNETLFDGRQVPTAIGNTSRGFDFGSIGSEFVSQVDVLKTPDAALSSGAIGATVNIKYPKPFDHPGMQLVPIQPAITRTRRTRVCCSATPSQTIASVFWSMPAMQTPRSAPTTSTFKVGKGETRPRAVDC